MSSNLPECHVIECLHSESRDDLRKINLCSIAIGLINVPLYDPCQVLLDAAI
jgi:hypothetical protein